MLAFGDFGSALYMMDFLRLIEQSSFSQWVTGSSSVFAFPSILLLHTIGMGVVVGISAGIDLRILGLAPALPLAPMEKFFPLLWIGFGVNAVTGTILLAADATTRVFNEPLVDKKPLTSDVKLLAVTSMIFWLGAITAGRLMAYLGPVSGLAK